MNGRISVCPCSDNEWFPRLDRETEPRVSDGTRINADPGIRRPGRVLTKHLSHSARTHSCLNPSTASIMPLSEIRPGARAAGRPVRHSLGPQHHALHARAFNGTQGQHRKIWGRKADGPYGEDLTVWWMIFGTLVSQKSEIVENAESNEMKDLIYGMYYIPTPTSHTHVRVGCIQASSNQRGIK